ncbi:MAG: phage portal protein [Elusimicrobia bacterium]|nr:phage portal protein [Elusimicrobiota bacterium]
MDRLKEDKKQELQQRIGKAIDKLLTCGSNDGLPLRDQMSLTEFLYVQARSAVSMGRFATEIIWTTTGEFHSFRPLDAGTMYKAVPQKNQIDTIRKQARGLLEGLKNKKLQPEKFENDEYDWVQVISSKPVQAFGPQEAIVYNCYPANDVEFYGYPVSPIDTVIASVTTHLNITNHNKIYFQNGRAARGILVIRSQNVDTATVNMIRNQFNSSINGVTNSWRLPIFAMRDEKDEVNWVSMDPSTRDAEFSFLYESNARVILSAFQMSPDELPGYSHLSRGTNAQTLSESNSEYKLEAARDRRHSSSYSSI